MDYDSWQLSTKLVILFDGFVLS